MSCSMPPNTFDRRPWPERGIEPDILYSVGMLEKVLLLCFAFFA